MAYVIIVLFGWLAAFLSSMVSAIALGYLEAKLNFLTDFGYWDNVSILFAGAFVFSTLLCGVIFAVGASSAD